MNPDVTRLRSRSTAGRQALQASRLRALWWWCAAVTLGAWLACGLPLAAIFFVAASYVIYRATRPPDPDEPEERGGCV